MNVTLLIDSIVRQTTILIAELATTRPVYQESYTTTELIGSPIGSVADAKVAMECRRCVVVTSSFMEDRYRREPTRYAREVDAYDRLRAEARLIATFEPTNPHESSPKPAPWVRTTFCSA